MSHSPAKGRVAALYAARVDRFDRLTQREAGLSSRYSRTRLVLALTAVGVLVSWLARGALGTPLLVVLTASVTAFVGVMVRHERVEQRRHAALRLAGINRDALSRVRRAWNDLGEAWVVDGLEDHPYAADLDVFGHASLAQMLGPALTRAGRAVLGRWLLSMEQARVDVVRARQAAVRELAPLLDFRQQLAGLAGYMSDARGGRASFLTWDSISRKDAGPLLAEDPAIGPFVAWAESARWLLDRPWISVLAAALGVVTAASFVATFVDGWQNPLWVVTSTMGWVLRWLVHHRLEASVAGASGERGLRGFTAIVALIAAQTFTSDDLRAAQGALRGRGGHAHVALRRLEQWVALADVRLSTYLYLFLQSLTLWDLHVWWVIERWRDAHGRDVRFWNAAVGHVEAASSLAALAHDQPEWTFPEFAEGGAPTVDAKGLGHPLLADAVRIVNDVTLGPPGRFMLITGSNMSGKSTLLRAIGLNLVLAHAGGPVCAHSFRTPLLSLHTSMRVADSLEHGLSLFMASLRRLEAIVRAARAATPERPACYLLDEVLQGTNSAERQIAVRTIVDHLLASFSIGAVTTHDLELASDASFSANADSHHLQETLSGDGDAIRMTFDYRLRPGPALAGNALQLLKMLGL